MTLTGDADIPDTPVCEVAPVPRESKHVDNDRDRVPLQKEGEDEHVVRLVNLDAVVLAAMTMAIVSMRHARRRPNVYHMNEWRMDNASRSNSGRGQ
jgi:hypothetical protein